MRLPHRRAISIPHVAEAQSRASMLLTGDHTGRAGDQRDLIYRWFTEPDQRADHPPEDQEYHSRLIVADLRAVAGRRAGDPVVTGLVARLQAASPEFRRLWETHEVGLRRADRKTLVHRRVGPLLMVCETLLTPDLGQRLLVLTPADDDARERLELLRVLGIEEFPPAVRVRV